jgi:hypothetical protein
MQTRRGFFGGVFTGVGAIALVGCIDQETWTGIVAPEEVALAPGMRYANILPSRVPAVRLTRAASAH